jgi:dienelactone hydrolase
MRYVIAALLFSCATLASAGLVGKEVSYSTADKTMKGYYVYDDAVQGPRPAVMVVHEWWGLNEYSRSRAEMLAKMGYAALAVDMYGDGKTADHPDDAGKFAAEVMQSLPVMKDRFNAALSLLKKSKFVDTTRIAAIGYCFGGGVVLAMAREGADLKAVATFHGSIATEHPAEKGMVKAKVLVCNGADDKFVSADAIKSLKSEMKAAGADFKFINYPGAIHGFSNPGATELGKKFSMAIAYNKNADTKSWAELQKFLKRSFK